MATLQEVETWKGRTAVDADGDKIGSVEDVYLDRQSGEPEWLTVKTGLLGRRTSFVPVRDAQVSGDDVRVAYDKDTVKEAPNVDPDGELSPEEERSLYEHYGRSDYGEWTDESPDRTAGMFGGGGDGESRFDASGTDRPGGRAETDDAMTRSEEELRVGTRARETGRARLRKYVTTEEETQTVPVQREEVRVEREPITDDNVDEAMRGPEITESEHEVVLHEEEPVVEKRVEPKERIRLERDVHTEEEQVSDEVRKERIEPEGDVG
jgi:uncharacterized protein (TIGR02271 family)